MKSGFLLTFFLVSSIASAYLDVGTFQEIGELKKQKFTKKTEIALAKKIIDSEKYALNLIGGAGVFLNYPFNQKDNSDVVLTALHVVNGEKDTDPNIDFDMFDQSGASLSGIKNSNIGIDFDNKASFPSNQFGEASSGEIIYTIGFAGGIEPYYNIGRILNEIEINALEKRFENGNEVKGTDHVPFNSDIEYVVAGNSYQGMSGGPAFTSDGKLIGILIRGGEIANPPPHDHERGFVYFRVLKIGMIDKKISGKSSEKLELQIPQFSNFKTCHNFAKKNYQQIELTHQFSNPPIFGNPVPSLITFISPLSVGDIAKRLQIELTGTPTDVVRKTSENIVSVDLSQISSEAKKSLIVESIQEKLKLDMSSRLRLALQSQTPIGWNDGNESVFPLLLDANFVSVYFKKKPTNLKKFLEEHSLKLINQNKFNKQIYNVTWDLTDDCLGAMSNAILKKLNANKDLHYASPQFVKRNPDFYSENNKHK